MLLVNGCTDVKKKDNFKIIESMKSPKSDISVFILKKRVLGGATVPYVYEFYFGKDINNINEKNIFLTLKGLNSYKIQWTSLNTIKLKIDASEILFSKVLFGIKKKI